MYFFFAYLFLIQHNRLIIKVKVMFKLVCYLFVEQLFIESLQFSRQRGRSKDHKVDTFFLGTHIPEE